MKIESGMEPSRDTSCMQRSSAQETDPLLRRTSGPAHSGKKTDKTRQSESTRPATQWPFLRVLAHGTGNGGLPLMILVFLSAVGSGIALPFMNVFWGNLIGECNRYFQPGSTMTASEFKSIVNKNSLLLVYLFIVKFVLNYVAMFGIQSLSLRISANMRLDYMRTLFRQPVQKIDEVSSGEVARTVTALSNTIQQGTSDRLVVLVQSFSLVCMALAVAFWHSWILTLITGSVVVLVLLSVIVPLKSMIKNQQQVEYADSKQAAIAGESFGAIRTVVSLGAEETLARKYSSWAAESLRHGLAMNWSFGLQLAFFFFGVLLSFALSFWYGVELYREERITSISTVVTVIFSVMLVSSVLGGISSPLILIFKAASASKAFFDVTDGPQVQEGELQSPAVSSRADIELHDVTFSYPIRPNTPVLRNLSLCIRQGQTTALVGSSGSGKSTVIALVERWYDVTPSTGCGAILIDGKNLNRLNQTWWRAQIGLVEQTVHLFNDSIFNNVALGLVGTQWESEPIRVKEELVKDACKEAFAIEFIERLPQGYDTLVGESGAKLSGGQKQRLAIARSIVKRPAILILDEATSSLDGDSEKEVQMALERVSHGRTTIVIAHRLSTIREADNIVVMAGGTIVESGCHAELMSNEAGMYHRMACSQQIKSKWEPSKAREVQIYKTEPGLLAAKPTEKTPLSSTRSRKRQGFFPATTMIVCEQKHLWFLFFSVLIATMVAGSSNAFQAWIMSSMIAIFRLTGQRLIDESNFRGGIFLILALTVGACYYVVGHSSNALFVHVSSTYREEYFRDLLKTPVSSYDDEGYSAGALVSRLSVDPKHISELFGTNGAFVLISIFNIVGCVAVSFAFGWKLTLVTLFSATPTILISTWMRIRYEKGMEVLNNSVYAESSQFATEAIKAFRTVIAFNIQGAIISKFSCLLQQQQKVAFRRASYFTLVFALADGIPLCAMALTFWYGGQLLVSRKYNPSSFFVIYSAMIQGTQAACQIFSIGPNIAQATASINRIRDAREPRQQAVIKRELTDYPTPSSRGGIIEFHDVCFQYSSQGRPAFLDFNVTIAAGQFVAFVGPSGCGKTTLLSLLERFYDIDQGNILLEGQDIMSLDLGSYRRNFSLVSQESILFQGSIRENLLMGQECDPGREAKRTDISKRMIQACRDAEIHDFIMSLPDGYETELSTHPPPLSGGQQQRLCIARALLRQPKLLLLDEASSSLDSHSESLVQASLERFARQHGMTIIAVAHRLATIQKADVIFVLDESAGGGAQIVESGTHAELLGRNGLYARMCRTQAFEQV